MPSPNPTLRVGILGTTSAVETTYLPALTSSTLQTHFDLHAIYSTDLEALRRLQKHHNIRQTTTSPTDILHNPEIDVVLNLLPFEYHEQYTVAALEAGKHVMVENPLSLSIQGFRRVRDAMKKGTSVRSHRPEGNSGPPKVFVGCARRYAPCFTDVFKKELASLDRVYYARCRNIAGPLNIPVIQHRPANGADGVDGPKGVNELNGMNGSKGQAGINDLSSPAQFQHILEEICGSEEDITPDRAAFCRFLGTLGNHDLSLMRETLGFPDAVSSVSITDPFYSVIFHYSNNSNGGGYPFTLVYEAGVDSLPRCDAHLTVYGARKTVSVEYDFPFPGEAAGKERSVRVVVEEMVIPGELGNGLDRDHGHGNAWDEDGNGDGTGAGYAVENGKRVSMNGKRVVPNGPIGNGVVRPRVKRTEYVSSSEEAYEREFLALHSYLTGDPGPGVKTTTEDALNDLRLLHMIFRHYDRQCGTIRTPLG